MKITFEWLPAYVSLTTGGDRHESSVEFKKTLFDMMPSITLFMARFLFNCDLRGKLGMVKVPCYIIRTGMDLCVPGCVTTFLKENLGGPSTIHILSVDGHLPHLSAPNETAQAILRGLEWRWDEPSTSKTS